MKPLYLAAVVLALVVGGCDSRGPGWFNIGNPKGKPLEVKLVNAPSADLEARVDALEREVRRLAEQEAKRSGRYK